MKNSSRKKEVLLLSLLIVLLTGCDTQNSQKEVSQALGINATEGTELSYSDTHGGFHGDGTKYIQLSFSDEEFVDSIKQSPEWKQLPLSTDLYTLIYGISNEKEAIGPYATDDSESALFPQIENGYYFFKDRFSESTDSQNSSDILSRSAFNFTIAIYDTDTNTLYFCEVDT